MQSMQFNEISRNPGADVDAYLEYSRIVGDDDGGTPFTTAQYDEYKKRVLPMRFNNRLYVSWTNPSGMDCKLIGPETPCFCKHRYKQHRTDLPSIPATRPIAVPCSVRGCRCATYRYVPLNSTQPLRCSGCKHFADEHSEKVPNSCSKGGCKCGSFRTSFSCGCQTTCDHHVTVVETRQERELRGHPVGQAVPFKAMGGLTGFSSLAEGYQRLDPSGAGAPGAAFLDQPITSSDHPFLRSNVEAITTYHDQKSTRCPLAPASQRVVDPEKDERLSARRRPGEDDMQYFERRYQERTANEQGHQSVGRGQLQSPQRLAISREAGSVSTQENPPLKGPKEQQTSK